MLDILYSIFQTIIHSIETILVVILSIPKYLTLLINLLNSLPQYLEVPLILAALASSIIAIKRLVF